MKICLIGITYPFRGGISHYTTLLFRELKKKHEVTFVSLKKQYPSLLFPGRTQLDEGKTVFDVENIPILNPMNPWTWVRAYRVIRDIRPDLALFQWWNPFFGPCFGTVGFLLRKRASVRVAFLCHNVRPHESTPLDRLFSTFAFRSADGFIVHSEEDLTNLRKIVGPDRPAVKTFHPTYAAFGFEKTPQKEEAAKRVGMKGRVLLFFGFIKKYKGVIHLIRAMPRILEQVDCTLWIVGEFYDARELYLAEITRLGLSEKIVVVDRYVSNEEVSAYFAGADLVVLPYVSATQSGITQIAFGLGKPVVATRVGGIPEAVEHGRTGFIVPPEDPASLADAVIRYFQEDRREEFCRNIRQQQEKFSWDRMVEAIEHIHAAVR
jgi:glycosyltransferase involved in cell wall biosynthesis